ncbi:protein fantom-like isoform X3 [Tachypleus tridentatus]|uniref:protein fantom-like isoform X3 n=1 Tax=Tachypleus tridentatus TaxID=6853 RepID=UPI003FCFD442
MADDPDRELFPVKEVRPTSIPVPGLMDGDGGPNKRTTAQLTRDEIEDKYLRLQDEHLILKKHARKQEDKIKRLATKLTRLVNDKKRLEQGVGRKRDVETEEMVQDLQDKVRDLERQNSQFREKLLVAKQQIVSNVRRHMPYRNVQARVDSGIPKSGMISRTGTPVMKPTSPFSQREDRLTSQNVQIEVYEQEIQTLKEQLRVRAIEEEEEICALKGQVSEGQKQRIQENIDLIRLHRDVKRKSSNLLVLETQNSELQEKLRITETSFKELQREIETLNSELKEERGRTFTLQGEVRKLKANQRAVSELEECITDLRNENKLLTDANEKLINSAIETKLDKNEEAERSLRHQITLLEATIKADVAEKSSVIDQLTKEKEKYSGLEKEYKELWENHVNLKEKLEELEKKTQFIRKDDSIDFKDFEEALLLVKQKHENIVEKPEFVMEGTHDKTDVEEKLKKMQLEYADAINELEKTRNMLLLQYKINQDYQTELEGVNEQHSQKEMEYQTRLEEYAHLLDMRAARIMKLEKQLQDIAYGTKQYKILDTKHDNELNMKDSIPLERGQNLFEIHIENLNLSKDGLEALGEEDPSVFLTWAFYEFEIQSTPVIKGHQQVFNHTSQYVVRVDDFFLYYLQKETTTLELQKAVGTDYITVAACQLSFKEILNQVHGRHHGELQLIGVKDGSPGVLYGTVKYWIRLKLPMEQALRLYKERSKALRYLDGNISTTQAALKTLNKESHTEERINELHIKIIKCMGLKARREDIQPSAYCVYKFYDLPDQDTLIIPYSNSPLFNDHKTFPLHMDRELDTYLRTKNLDIFVFDDTDPDLTSYLGKISIPLLALAHDKAIKGMFELRNESKEVTGTIEVSLYWQRTYFSPTPTTGIPKPIDELKDKEGSNIEDCSTRYFKEQPNLDRVEKLSIQSEIVKHNVDRKEGFISSEIQCFTPGTKMCSRATPITSSTGTRNRNESTRSALSAGYCSSASSEDCDDDESVSPKLRISSTEPEPLSSQANQAPPTPGTSLKHHSPEPVNSNFPEQQISVERFKPEPAPRKSLKHTGELSTISPEESAGSGPTTQSVVNNNVEGQSCDTVVSTLPETIMKECCRNPEDEESEEEVIMTSSLQHLLMRPNDTVFIEVSRLSLLEGATVLNDTNVEMLFVEYKFLGYPAVELETPFSLPKPHPPHYITFNFQKVFQVDPVNHMREREMLAAMLDSPTLARITFIVVSEPPEDRHDMDCEDIGYAYVDLREIMQKKQDLIGKELNIYDATDEHTIIGKLTVTVQCLAALENM